MMIKMGFSEGWLKWIRTCIFQSSMSILVNGSPTEDFNVRRCLRQGDPLSPFLFLIVAEGLAGMMRRAVEIGRFKGFHVNDNIQFQILQFADDTILMGEGVWDNLRTIKVLLRSFELVSDVIPFKFLGIPVGANPRRRETWKLVVEAMTK
ncbi:LINE-1 reverse transcriptase like, partial [Trifolium medium]|nr:LINE-1 reverse transcriptase like [Trifolium medium]